MDPLQAVVAYWLDCIEAEGALEQSFGLSGSGFRLQNHIRARLFDGAADPFIFAKRSPAYEVGSEPVQRFVKRVKSKDQDLCFGYPLLIYVDQIGRQQRAAPLLVQRLESNEREGRLELTAADEAPMLGALALDQLGIKGEQAVSMNRDIETIFQKTAPERRLDAVLFLLKRETRFQAVETIDPQHLNQSMRLLSYDGQVLYNRAVLFASEAPGYNLHLIRDLRELTQRKDMRRTALAYLCQRRLQLPRVRSAPAPILPFAFDEWQLKAIRRIERDRLTVVTGPPGTGKSQFIANLVINLFLQNKRVLLVSHTGEAVAVVNERISSQFAHLMMRTGNKAHRQDLGRQLAALVDAYNDQSKFGWQSADKRAVHHSWRAIKRQVRRLKFDNQLLRLATVASQPRWGQMGRLIGSWFFRATGKGQAEVDRLSCIQQLKQQHVANCRKYVAVAYVRTIFKNHDYGSAVAAIEAMQRPGKFDPSQAHQAGAALSLIRVWSCTLKSLAASFPLQPNLFDYVIFDEASQIDLPSAAPALYRARKVVVVGDENQLSHIARLNDKVEAKLAIRHQLSARQSYPALTRYTDTSLFQSAKRSLHKPEEELRNHYRSNAQIARLFSTIFYGGGLRIYEPPVTLPAGLRAGCFWIDCQGSCQLHRSGSRYNQQEAAAVVKLLCKLASQLSGSQLSVGVTTPYAKQRDLLIELTRRSLPEEFLSHLKVLSVHQFQGAEVDILLFSPVLALKGDGNSDYWYLTNKQLLNVAISRAKQQLLIVGDYQYALQSHSKLHAIAVHCGGESAHQSFVANRPMNRYEQQLLVLISQLLPSHYRIEPQYVAEGRFTLDFALLSTKQRIAVELDGQQHEIIGGLPVIEDQRRDEVLAHAGWQIARCSVYELLHQPSLITERLRALIVSR